MKILFAGCKDEFSKFQEDMALNLCVQNEFKDGGLLFQEIRRMVEGYDWVILDGRKLLGEMDLARSLVGCAEEISADQVDGVSEHVAHHQCGVAVDEHGSVKFSCALHESSRAAGASERSGGDLAKAFVFEYQAACGNRR